MTLQGLNWLRLLLCVLDAVIVNLCIWLALWLRFDGAIPSEYMELYFKTAPIVTVSFVATAYLFGLYNRIWQYASLDAALLIPASVTVALFIGRAAVTLTQDMLYPRSVAALAWALCIIAIGASRFGWRFFRTRLGFTNGANGHDRVRTLIYGAGDAGALLARDIDHDPTSRYSIIGFIDSCRRLQGMVIAGHRVLGTHDDIPRLVKRHNIDEIIAALPSGAKDAVADLFHQASDLGIHVRTVPRLLELVNGQSAVAGIRDVSTADVLGRAPDEMELDLQTDYISGRTILVTGAGGSIGSEICRQLCRYNPGRIILLGRGENRIHSVYYELSRAYPGIEFVPIICNLTSSEAVEDSFRRYRPEVVLHAAAHKHVYLMEVNAVEAARNNILGTAILAGLAEKYDVDRFIFVSTDKAASPANTMGATKRFCERIVTERDHGAAHTKFMAVRFGNVLGSSGSVLPIFQECVAQGRPIPVTHPEVDRFFMTIPEAAFLVLQAGALDQPGNTYVLDMRDPIKIVDLARTVLEMNGRDPDDPSAIEFIGLRPGEKLHETLVADYEELVPTECSRVLRVEANGHAPDCMPLAAALDEVKQAVADCDERRVRWVLVQATNADIVHEKPRGHAVGHHHREESSSPQVVPSAK